MLSSFSFILPLLFGAAFAAPVVTTTAQPSSTISSVASSTTTSVATISVQPFPPQGGLHQVNVTEETPDKLTAEMEVMYEKMAAKIEKWLEAHDASNVTANGGPSNNQTSSDIDSSSGSDGEDTEDDDEYVVDDASDVTPGTNATLTSANTNNATLSTRADNSTGVSAQQIDSLVSELEELAAYLETYAQSGPSNSTLQGNSTGPSTTGSGASGIQTGTGGNNGTGYDDASVGSGQIGGSVNGTRVLTGSPSSNSTLSDA